MLISWVTSRTVRKKSGQPKTSAAISPSFPAVRQHLTEKLVSGQTFSSVSKRNLQKMKIKGKTHTHTVHSVPNQKTISPSAVTT